jgi:hypothetical protein
MTRTGLTVLGLVLCSKSDARPVTKADIEAKLRQVQDQVSGAQEAATGPRARVAGIAGGAALVLLAYAVGRRRGGRSRAVVEVRRV